MRGATRAALLVVGFAAAPAAAESASEQLRGFTERWFEHTVLEHPEFATAIGHPQGHDRWTDLSPRALERRDAAQRGFLETLRAIDPATLSEAERLDRRLALHDLELGVAGQRFPEELLAIDQLSGVQQAVARVVAQTPCRTLAGCEDLVARLRAVPTLVEQTIALLERGLARGITKPRVALRDLPQQLRRQIFDDPMQSPLLAAFRALPDTIAPGERERLAAAARAAYAEAVAPAFGALEGFLAERYLPGARGTIALAALPDGAEWYAWRVRLMTTTDATPEQIHRIGLAEVARIRAAMEALIAEIGFEGGFEAFLAHLRSDPRFFHDEAEALLRGYRDIAKRADAQLVRLFGHLPRLPYGVEPVPSHAERSQTTAYYQPGSLEAGRPGIFFANTWDLKSRPKWEMVALALHEAVPGHHLQIAIAQELSELPWFRRFGGVTAFTEGWGLYAESLGEEMGLYDDAYARFGRLTYEMWRAVRLVVDTGIHALGWSRQRAIDYFVANAGKAEHDIAVEVDRYIVWPGQALAYKMGELELQALRAHARQQLGERFDLRAFHDAVLGAGALPLEILRERMRGWLAAQRGGA